MTAVNGNAPSRPGATGGVPDLFVFPASFAQQRLWFLDQLSPGSPAYNVSQVLRIVGPLDSDVLERSLQEIVQRHEALRTVFGSVDGQPVQLISPDLLFRISIVDLTKWASTDCDAEAKRIAAEEGQRPFDIATGPLIRVTVIKQEPETNFFVLTMHHIVSDGWSLGVFFRELSETYKAFSQGNPSPLTPLSIQYADYAMWQREQTQGEKLISEVAYWKERLAGAPPRIALPTDRPRPPAQTFRGARHPISFPVGLTRQLKQLSQREGATLYMTLLAAFQVLLLRYTSQEDVVVGSPIANRTRSEVEALIGFFVNTLVLRTDLSGEPGFREVLNRVRTVALDAYAHQDLPFEKLVEELKPERDLSRSPIFQVTFAFQNTPQSTLAIPGASVVPLPELNRVARFDLELFLWEEGGRLDGVIVYSSDLFDSSTIERMAGHFGMLLEAIVSEPDRSVWDLGILTDAERLQLAEEWNRTEASYRPDKTLHALFEAHATRTPEALAVVFEDEKLTYGALNERANRLANLLRRRGVGPEVLVGVCLERSVELVVGILAILKAGGAYVPLDLSYPADRLAFMVEDSEVNLILTEERLRSRFSSRASLVTVDSMAPLIQQESDESCSSSVGPENLAYVIYTSGSTGRPKGVLVTHHNVVRLLKTTERFFQFGKNDVWTLFHSAAFDFSVWELWGALAYGGQLIVVPYLVSRSPREFYELLSRHKVTVLNQTPSAFRQLIQAEEDMGQTGLLALRLVIFGGETLDPSTLRPWFSRHGDRSPQLVNMYGITETTVHVTYRPLTLEDLESSGSPMGRALPDLRTYVLDRRFQPLPIGIPGEIYVSGAGVARGYLKRPELTQERFLVDPFAEGSERIYKSGDLARRLASGELDFFGRADSQVKIRGFRIEPGEIEDALSRHPAVRSCIVTLLETGGERRLVGYIIPADGPLPPVSEIRSFLTTTLPAYMIPSAFVVLSAFPLTSNGKIDRKALPAPDQTRPELEDVYMPPRNSVERTVAEIWACLLNLERVGVNDDFFSLGGHSLLATQVISRMRDELGVDIPLRHVFEAPTVASLCERVVASAPNVEEKDLKPARVGRNVPLPLSSGQHRLWFLHQIDPGNPAFNVPIARRMRGQLDDEALRAAIEEIVRRHEVLRTRFVSNDGSPTQEILPAGLFNMGRVDLTRFPLGEREERARGVARQEALRPFDLTSGCLLRAALLQLAGDDHVLLVTIHHIATDAWSLGVFFRELSAIYGAYAAGAESPLADLPIQYADWAVWQRDWLSKGALESQLAYWRKQLSGAPRVLELPDSRRTEGIVGSRGASHEVSLSPALSGLLKGLSDREGVTLFMTLLGAFAALLSRLAGSRDIVIGTDVANRNRSETEQLIGFFVNVLPLRLDLSGNPSFRTLLARAREVALGAFSHQELPFEKLVEDLAPERRAGVNPLVQVLLVMEIDTGTEALPGLIVSQFRVENETSRFGLVLFARVEGSQILITWLYNRDLFGPTAIARMSTGFERILAAVAADPATTLDRLEVLTEQGERQNAMEKNGRREAQASRLRGARRQGVDISRAGQVVEESLSPGERLPLVLRPDEGADLDLPEWGSTRREFIESKLLDHGAILFRGFGVRSAAEFERFASSLCPELFGEYGDLPREAIGGKVYGSTPYPSDQAILFHNESSHMHRWPMKIWFFCVTAAEKGGETPIVDCRRVLEKLDRKIRDRFAQRGLMYVRNYTEGLDVSWETFYGTKDRSRVEELCRKAGTELEWRGASDLRTRQRCPAVIRHPQTGELSFFNQLQLHHVSCLEPAVRESLSSMMREDELPRNVYYGDGSRIEDSVMEEVGGVYRECAVEFPWQPGDVLMLNNMLVAHSRNPYEGARKIVVAMGEMINQSDILG